MIHTFGRRIDLQAFLGDTPRDVFDREIRDRRRLFVPGALSPGEANALFGLERFDELATVHDMPYPDLELIENGMPASPEISKRKRALPGALADKLKEGATIRFRAVADLDLRVNAVALALGDDLDAVMQVNGFLTPPNSSGFLPHYDEQDIWIVQTQGSKVWSIHGPGGGPNDVPLPLNRTGFDPKKHTVGPVIEEITLHEGDTMYLPRGTGHSARCTDEASVHLTFALIIVTVGDVASRYVKAMHLAKRDLRERVSHDEMSDIEALGRRLRSDGMLGEIDTRVLAGVVRSVMQEFTSGTEQLALGSLIRVLRPPAAPARVVYRPETVWRLVDDHGVRRLHVGRSSYRMGEIEIAMIRDIEAAGAVDVDSLVADHGAVDVPAVLDELLKAGIVARA